MMPQPTKIYTVHLLNLPNIKINHIFVDTSKTKKITFPNGFLFGYNSIFSDVVKSVEAVKSHSSLSNEKSSGTYSSITYKLSHLMQNQNTFREFMVNAPTLLMNAITSFLPPELRIIAVIYLSAFNTSWLAVYKDLVAHYQSNPVMVPKSILFMLANFKQIFATAAWIDVLTSTINKEKITNIKLNPKIEQFASSSDPNKESMQFLAESIKDSISMLGNKMMGAPKYQNYGKNYGKNYGNEVKPEPNYNTSKSNDGAYQLPTGFARSLTSQYEQYKFKIRAISDDICQFWNFNRCSYKKKCRNKHICIYCNQQHMVINCTTITRFR